jgi:hypothetical protein
LEELLEESLEELLEELLEESLDSSDESLASLDDSLSLLLWRVLFFVSFSFLTCFEERRRFCFPK